LNSGGWENDIINNPKILIPQTGDKITAAIDRNCYYHLNNIHSFAPHKKGLELQYVCAILNSSLINWYYKRISLEEDRALAQIDIETAEKLPIIVASKQYQIQVSHIVDYLHFINSIESINFDTLIINFFEQIIDGMVYELYFPELLKKYDCEIIKHLGELPEFTEGMSDEDKMEICQKVFDRLNDATHPVRINLDRMKEEIPEIRIIEGLDN
ncbi:MAG TPA: TaqI-like C-terminal specificity domain-containing protein, partial [Dysgonamonadaceae bacterium]|nr:TaqI-like C-terminal specificity domain-containing protein [Dysgonamonadaceae bacterium]